MRVVSKMLTADVRVVRVALEDGKMVMEGMVKEIMPMRVEMTRADVAEMLRVASLPLRERLAARLPERIRRVLVRDATAPAS